MKKKREETFFYKKVVKIPMYGGNFIIVFTNDTEKICKIVNTPPNGVQHLYAHTFHNFMYQGYESFAVCFNFWDTMPVTLGTLMHEITHCGNRILLSREFEPDWINDEAEAYLKAWMGDEVYTFMKQCNL
jgi:hypothetical protein